MTIPNKPFRASDGHTEFGTSGQISLAAASAGMATPFRIGDLAGKSAEVTAGPPEVFESGGPWPGSGVCYFYSNDTNQVIINGLEVIRGADNDKGMDHLIGSFTYNHLDTITITNSTYWVRRFNTDSIKLGAPVSATFNQGQAIFPGLNGDVCFFGDDHRLTKVSSDGHVIYNKHSQGTYARGPMFGGIIRGETTNLVNLGDPINATIRPYLKPLKVSPTRPVELTLVSKDSDSRVLQFTADKYCHFAFMAVPIGVEVGSGQYSYYQPGIAQDLKVILNDGTVTLYDSFTSGGVNTDDGTANTNGPSFNIELFKGDVLVLEQSSPINSSLGTYAAFTTELAL